MTFRVSLRTALTAVVLTVAIISAAIAFTPLRAAALNSAQASAQQFSLTVSDSIVVQLSKYFGSMQQTATVMTQAARLGAWASNDTSSILTWMNYGSTLGADSINIILDGTVMWTAGFVTPSNVAVPAGQVVIVRYNGTFAHTGVYNATDLSLVSSSVTPSTLNFRTRQYYGVIRLAQGWGNPFIGVSLGVSESVLPCGAPIVAPNGTSYGAFYVRTRAKIIVDYFRTLKVAKTGVAMLIDPVTKFLVATSNPLDPTTVVVNGTTTVAQVMHAVDPLIRRVYGAVGQALFTCQPLPCTNTVGSGADLVYVTVASVNDTFNLNKRLVVMIPSSDFLEDIRTASSTSLGAAAGAVGGLMIVAFIVLWLISAPLTALEEKLYESTTFKSSGEAGLEEDGTPLCATLITEISNIQDAYVNLQNELAKVKRFLPQSVLKQLEAADEDDEDDEDGRDEDGDEGTDKASASGGGDAKSESHRSGVVKNAHRRHSHHTATASHAVSDGKSHKSGSHTSSSRQQQVAKQVFSATTALQSRTCTVVFANMNDTHKCVASRGAAELITLHTAVMTTLIRAVDECKGVVDSFHGDRFFITFNASTNCATHATKAAALMVSVRDELQLKLLSSSSTFHGIRFGAATGKALCGNLGTDRIQRFCTLGALVSHAYALMSRCRSFSCDNFVAGDGLQLMEYQYDTEHVTVAKMGDYVMPSIVARVVARKAQKDDEWMYTLEDATAISTADGGVLPTAKLIPLVLQRIVQNKLDDAKKLLDQVSSDELGTSRVAHIRLLVDQCQNKQPSEGVPTWT